MLVTSRADAGGMSVYPLNVSLPPDGSTAQFHVSNPSEESAYIQVMAVEWRPLEEMQDAPVVTEILAVPPVFDLEAGGTQLIRLAARKPIDDGVERAYRLIVTEVPRLTGLVPNTLAIATRMSLPIFITPPEAAAAPTWSFAEYDFDRPALVLTNVGSAHIDVKKISLQTAGDEKPVFESEDGGHVLAGGHKNWPLDIELARLKGPVTVNAMTSVGPIEAVVSLPDR